MVYEIACPFAHWIRAWRRALFGATVLISEMCTGNIMWLNAYNISQAPRARILFCCDIYTRPGTLLKKIITITVRSRSAYTRYYIIIITRGSFCRIYVDPEQNIYTLNDLAMELDSFPTALTFNEPAVLYVTNIVLYVHCPSPTRPARSLRETAYQ